jgi:hypothetical protein
MIPQNAADPIGWPFSKALLQGSWLPTNLGLIENERKDYDRKEERFVQCAERYFYPLR